MADTDYPMEVDPMGDVLNEGPHIFCRFDGEIGPYAAFRSGKVEMFVTTEASYWSEKQLRAEDRRPFFDSGGRK